MKNKIIVGIDPDVDKNGVAIVDADTKEHREMTLNLPDLINIIRGIKPQCDAENKRLCIVVEAGWINDSNWHIHPKMSARCACRIGRNQGENHQRGKDIIELCNAMGIPTEAVRPLKKCWKGKDGKITHDELNYIVGGNLKHTNQDARDALLLAWVYSDLPIRVPVRK